jgi:PKD repeat protein
LKGKILVLLVAIALLVGVLSGCIEEEDKNDAPTAAFTCVETGYVDAEITFADTSTDSDGEIESWSWSLDGAEDSTEQDYVNIFTAEGTYIIILTVTDDEGETSESDPCTITIMYEPPTVEIAEAYEGENITVNATEVSFTSTVTEGAGTVEVANYSWDFGDGSVAVEGVNSTTYTYNTTGTFTVTLTVTDSNDKTGTGTLEITVKEATT